MILPVILQRHKVDSVFLGSVNFHGFCTACTMDFCSYVCVIVLFYFIMWTPGKLASTAVEAKGNLNKDLKTKNLE